MNSKRYYSNLVPSEHRVLPDYFQGSPYPSSEQNGLKGISIAVAITLLTVSLFTLAYIPFFLVLVATGLLLLPGIGRMVARACRIRLTASVRKVVLIVLLIVNLPFAVAFGVVKSRLVEARRTELFREQQAARQAAFKEQQRKDSLDLSLQRIAVFYQQGKTDKALLELDRADLLAKTRWEIADVNRKRIEVSLIKATDLMDKGQYNMAINLLSGLHELDTNDTDVLYQRACSYVRTDSIAAAVHDAKRAMLRGHKAASTLYEKINPLKKRIAYYTTMCNDGSISSAVGRGACSHHGGVATRRHPIYETYRQYE